MKVVAAALAAFTSVALVAPAAVAAVPVSPGTAARGADPRVPWYDRASQQVHAGDARTSFAGSGTVSQFRGVAGGFALERRVGGEDVLTKLSTTGQTRRLARQVSTWEVATGNGGGRRVAVLRGSAKGVVVDVVRVSDGTLVARRKARDLFDFHNGRVWLENANGQLVRWEVATGRLVHRNLVTWAVDAAKGVVAHRRGGCTWISPLRADAGWRAWCSPEAGVFSWSPDGRRVITHGLPTGDDQGVTRKVVVRNARTGKLVRAFRGYFADGSPAPRWENSSMFLIPASSGQPTGEAAVMRLHTDGRVVRASTLGGDWPWETRVLVSTAR